MFENLGTITIDKYVPVETDGVLESAVVTVSVTHTSGRSGSESYSLTAAEIAQVIATPAFMKRVVMKVANRIYTRLEGPRPPLSVTITKADMITEFTP